ncbi:hypothetical protein Tco_0610551 [Tanacetum coccineum]
MLKEDRLDCITPTAESTWVDYLHLVNVTLLKVADIPSPWELLPTKEEGNNKSIKVDEEGDAFFKEEAIKAEYVEQEHCHADKVSQLTK